MVTSVKMIDQKMGKRRFMVELHAEMLEDFEPAKIADRIEGWGTIYNVERVTIGQGKEFARLYVTTTDLAMDSNMLKRSVKSISEQLKIENHDRRARS